MPLLDSSPLSLILPFKSVVDALEAAHPARPTKRK